MERAGTSLVETSILAEIAVADGHDAPTDADRRRTTLCTLSPRNMFTGQTLNHDRHCSYKYGEYGTDARGARQLCGT